MTSIFIYSILHKGQNVIAFKFEYKNNEAVVAVIKNLLNRKYSASKKIWYIPFRNDYKEYLTLYFRQLSTVELIFGELDTPENRTMRASIQRRVYLHMLRHRFATHLPEQGQDIIPFNNEVNLMNTRYNADVIMIEPFKWSEDKDHFIIPSVFGHV